MSTIKTNTLSTLDGSYSVPSETLARGACRAWVNFNGTGTVAIRASFNVSSITDNGTGNYTVNFTEAMADANYAAPVNINSQSYGNGIVDGTTRTTSSVGVISLANNGTAIDAFAVDIAIFR